MSPLRILLCSAALACSAASPNEPAEPPAEEETGDSGAEETETTDAGTSSAESESESESGSEDTGTDPPSPSPLTCEGWNEADFPEEPVTFTVEGSIAIMAGYVDGSTPRRLRSLLRRHPEVETLVMPFVPGSADDVSNLEAARAVREAGLDTCVPSTGLIASGGVDFFLAGVRRSAADGALVGVHSWADGNGTEGSDLPMDHPDHALFLDYYAEIGIDAAFYWFTLEAAPADDIHWMTRPEIETHGVEAD